MIPAECTYCRVEVIKAIRCVCVCVWCHLESSQDLVDEELNMVLSV